MRKVGNIFLMMLISVAGYGQSLVFSGTVSAAGTVQDDVLIDIYEYNSPIRTLHTDTKGYFSFPLIKGKEYILLFYKSGYMLQSVSISDSRQNPITNYFLPVNLDKDERSPDGLYFKPPVKRIAADVTGKTFIDTKFDVSRIRPRHRADSIMVLLNRAQANQYILVGNTKLNNNQPVTPYSRQVAENINKEVSDYRTKLAENKIQYDSLCAEEDKHQRATMHLEGDKQLDEMIETQRLLSQRMGSLTDHYLLEQQQMLASSRLDELEALRYREEPMETDTIRIVIRDKAKKAKSKAVNDRWRAMDDNKKLQLYNKYQVQNYQEYIEMLSYRNRKSDTAHAIAANVTAPKSAALATITPADTSDNLSKMTDTQRTLLIREALDEEERFKNYEETTETKTIDGEEVTVREIRIADDHYEMQVNKKKYTRYFKNDKPITKLTFEFETKRRLVDVLSTIRQVEKFGK